MQSVVLESLVRPGDDFVIDEGGLHCNRDCFEQVSQRGELETYA